MNQTTVVYSKVKPDIKADRYLCLSTDMDKIEDTRFKILTDWVVDEKDTNAIVFFDSIFKYRLHPYTSWGISVDKITFEKLKELKYCYNFIHIKE